MIKIFFVSCAIIFSVFSAESQEIEADIKAKITCSGAITDVCIGKGKLLAATENGCIDIYSLSNYNLEQKIKLPKIIDFLGDSINPNIYSVDILANKILIVSQGLSGFSNVYLWENNTTSKLIDCTKNYLAVKKAVFISEDKILMGMLSNELGMYNLKMSEFEYMNQVSPYAFSDFALSEDKSKVITADESGIVHLINVENGKIVAEPKSVNVDNVYQIAYSKNIVVTGGRDRRLGIYNFELINSFYLESDFLILCLALSKDGKMATFMSGENGEFAIVDTKNGAKLLNEKQDNSALSTISFISKTELLTANEKAEIVIWNLKK